MSCASKPPQPVAKLTRTDLEALATRREVFPVVTCYDTTTANWVTRGGIRVLVVGDSAAQLVLGLAPGEAAPVDFMVAITAAVRRGAPTAYVIGDLPRGAADSDVASAVANAYRLIAAGADAVKLEVTEAHSPIVSALRAAGIDVVAHLQHRTDGVRCTGTTDHAEPITPCALNRLIKVGILMLDLGVSMLLLEGLDEAASAKILSVLRAKTTRVPLLGCDAGKGCDGQVRVLHDLLGLAGDAAGGLGVQIQDAAARWVERLRAD